MKLHEVVENGLPRYFIWELRLRREFVALNITDNDNWYTILQKDLVTDKLIDYARGLNYDND